MTWGQIKDKRQQQEYFESFLTDFAWYSGNNLYVHDAMLKKYYDIFESDTEMEVFPGSFFITSKDKAHLEVYYDFDSGTFITYEEWIDKDPETGNKRIMSKHQVSNFNGDNTLDESVYSTTTLITRDEVLSKEQTEKHIWFDEYGNGTRRQEQKIKYLQDNQMKRSLSYIYTDGGYAVKTEEVTEFGATTYSAWIAERNFGPVTSYKWHNLSYDTYMNKIYTYQEYTDHSRLYEKAIKLKK